MYMAVGQHALLVPFLQLPPGLSRVPFAAVAVWKVLPSCRCLHMHMMCFLGSKPRQPNGGWGS